MSTGTVVVLLTVWAACAAAWTATLWWSNRFRRDRERPTASLSDLWEGWVSPLELMSRDYYVPESQHVATIVRAVLAAITVVFFGAFLLATRTLS